MQLCDVGMATLTKMPRVVSLSLNLRKKGLASRMAQTCSLFLLLAIGLARAELITAQIPHPGTNETAGQSKQNPPSDSPSLRIRVDVNLTLVYATVLNPGGWIERNLTRNDFDLKENGQKQDIAFFSRESDLPLRVALLIDSSLSTARDLKFESEAALRFFHSVLRPQDGAAIFDFSYDVNQLSDYTNDIAALSRAIKGITTGTATSLYDAIYSASKTLKPSKQKKVIVIVSDGADTTSQVGYDDALRAANEAQTIIYSIVIIPIKNEAGRALGGEHALMTLSEETGGKAFFPNSVSELDAIYSRISEELRTQYALGFYSTVSAPSRELRRINLTAHNPKLEVRTRRGYFPTTR
jgi:Ca-activated chloride channel family protein